MADEIKNQEDDFVIKNQYANLNEEGQYATSPDTTTNAANSKTGSGASAPEINLGVDESGNPIKEKLNYSWEQKAEERANLSYQSDVLQAKSNMLENRQTLESQGQQYQSQVAMDQYSKNQSIEKAGWTGGYVLDTERQMNYLKQTIQSQLYGQTELQKYGYNTSLAAARLAYDTNKYDLALQYYNTALSRAVSEAEITGYYVSPEAGEMLDQYSVAARTLNDETSTEEEKQRADKILEAVYEWFEANGISKNGVETYQHLVEERTHRMSVEQMYEWINDDKNQVSTDTFARLDNNGNKIYNADGTGLETLNFKTMSDTEILDYIQSSPQALQQYYSRLDSIAYEMENTFTSWCKKQYGFTGEDGNLIVDKDYEQAFLDYINTEKFADKIHNEVQKLLGNFDDEEQQKERDELVAKLLNGWSVNITLPDGTEHTLQITTSYYDKTADQQASYLIEDENTKQIKGIDKDGNEVSIDINYLKDANNFEALSKALTSESMSGLMEFFNQLNASSPTALAESISNWNMYVKQGNGKNIPYVSSLTNMFNTLTALITSTGSPIGIIVDQAQADGYKQQVNDLNRLKDGLKEIFGEHNWSLLSTAAKEYESMSEQDKNKLSETQKEYYKNALTITGKIDKIQEAVNYASKHDSGIFTDPWDYISDSWSRTAENWNDGYQFGDVTRTAFNAIGNAATTVASTIWGGIKFLFSWL